MLPFSSPRPTAAAPGGRAPVCDHAGRAVLTGTVVGWLLLLLAPAGPLPPAAAQSTPPPSQTVVGAGNQTATDIGNRSPLIRSAVNFLKREIKTIKDKNLREQTLDAVTNPDTVIAHRVNVTDAVKATILQQLRDAGLVDPADDATFPGGLPAGVFPPVVNDGTDRPRLPLTFYAAPGSSFGSHHSQPGGLAVHEAFNTISDLSLADAYRTVYGQTNLLGLPIISPHSIQFPQSGGARAASSKFFNRDVVVAAPVWHDWAKTMVFQWNADGTEFQELNFGGNGLTDNNGQSGNSKTGGHHILSLAESMSRSLPADFIIAQACAHSNPTLGNEYKVVNWLRAAAIVAQVDPVGRGYVAKDAKGAFRLPALRKLGDVSLNDAGQTNLLVEYTLNNLSDADFTFTIPSVAVSQVLLLRLAPEFGYNQTTDPATYNNRYRNVALSYLSAERLTIIYGNEGLAGVRAEVQKLRAQGVL